MARKPRMERSDGIYHVINRGNYKSYIFETEGARKSFEKALFEACKRMGWRLLGFVIMSNHFHLCLSTPKGNLSAGMQWLEGTYAMRFNRFRQVNGHLFQGRFKALIVEPGDYLLRLIDYIHLNPLRVGLEEKDKLGKYRWSSLYYFPKIKARVEYLDASWLDYLSGGEDSRSGWKYYLARLRLRAEDDPDEMAKLEKQMNRGWCIGSQSFKKALAKEFFEEAGILRLEGTELSEFNMLQWEMMLEACMKCIGKTVTEAQTTPKSVNWKMAIAVKMKRESSVSNKWLSQKLSGGVPRGLSANCGTYQRRSEGNCKYARKLRNLTFAT